MKYSNFINKNTNPSRLGFGLMRLPIIENDNGQINYKESRNLVEKSLELGINYFDTAYVYHERQSEIFAGEIFKDIRDKVYLATKLPVWKVEKPGDFEYILDAELTKMQTEYIDFYLLHALDKERFQMVKDHHIYESLVKAKNDGKVRYIGFSFHDDLDTFKEIIDTYEFDFCQIQLNYLDENYQAGLEGMKYAKEKGLGVVVMEPLRGGQLANLPASIKDKLGNYTPQSLAFSYLLNLEEVDVILSGMNEIEQIEENAKVFSEISPNSLSEEQLNKINYLKNEIATRLKVDCTRCNYCMPCPAGVKIPEIFSIYNNKYIFEESQKATDNYKKLVEKNSDQSQCIECGLCESKCPQHLNIIEDLKSAHKDLKGGI